MLTCEILKSNILENNNIQDGNYIISKGYRYTLKITDQFKSNERMN